MYRGGPDQNAQQTHSNEHDAETDVDEVDRQAERARERADGRLARLWHGLRSILGRD